MDIDLDERMETIADDEYARRREDGLAEPWETVTPEVPRMSSNQQRVHDELVETLRTVACCDQRVGVGELGLVDSVTVSDDGVAHIEVLPCCSYGMARLEHEVEQEDRTVSGVTTVDVEVAWDGVWDPVEMADSVEEATPDIEELAKEHDLEPRWLEYEASQETGE